MRWQGRRGSAHIEDRRGSGPRLGRGGGGLGRGGVQVGGFGLIAIVLIGWFLGVDVTPMLEGAGAPAGQSAAPRELSQAERDAGEFVSVTLADTEEVWQEIFRANGLDYTPVTLVLFSQVTPSSCGNASGATGPFYCPVDGKVYLDTAFFATMQSELGARGDFAFAYVVAHEVAHHVQDELGILSQTMEARRRVGTEEGNRISVMTELQADCLSGVWAKAAEDRFGALDPGDIQEALDAAARIGDDTLMRNAGRVPMPESFTHGTSEQRQRWFAEGYDSGDMNACDTFRATDL
ncbi:KPN_02809 family neutral zinc metallopeptidase [Frigidibacter sp. MR17.24]|uniref:KPN_02809 family neutral zinc metallopeptidase n=1 Tax=Frigidibacter sp. MR17.24 TaxID=3127345 RepID=UPI003012D701